jgi:hypothetical protein
MHDYLGAFFTEYKRNVTIPGIIRDFKPNGGVRNLKAAIEFKFADTHQEVLRAMGGVFEDISGYAGSLDWKRFYSVIYQTEHFESDDRIKSELSRAGTVTWKALLVTGAGARTRNRRTRQGDRTKQTVVKAQAGQSARQPLFRAAKAGSAMNCTENSDRASS